MLLWILGSLYGLQLTDYLEAQEEVIEIEINLPEVK